VCDGRPDCSRTETGNGGEDEEQECSGFGELEGGSLLSCLCHCQLYRRYIQKFRRPGASGMKFTLAPFACRVATPCFAIPTPALPPPHPPAGCGLAGDCEYGEDCEEEEAWKVNNYCEADEKPTPPPETPSDSSTIIIGAGTFLSPKSKLTPPCSGRWADRSPGPPGGGILRLEEGHREGGRDSYDGSKRK
jgi:hypothetical protein